MVDVAESFKRVERWADCRVVEFICGAQMPQACSVGSEEVDGWWMLRRVGPHHNVRSVPLEVDGAAFRIKPSKTQTTTNLVKTV